LMRAYYQSWFVDFGGLTKLTAGSLWTKKVLLAVTSRGFKEYGTSIFRSWSSDKLKLKTNVIYTYFNQTLNEQGLGSVLFNALNAIDS
jgi:hypothetical protein